MAKEKNYKSKETILEAALIEFSENSFEDASLNKIIKTSQTSKGTFYYHFKNKDDLYFTLLKVGFQQKWEFISSHINENSNEIANDDIFDILLSQAKIGILFGIAHPEYHKLSNMFLKEKGTTIYKNALAYLNSENDDILSTMIKNAYQKGEINQSISEKSAVKILSFMFSSFDDIFNRGDNPDKLIDKLSEYMVFLKHGLASKK